MSLCVICHIYVEALRTTVQFAPSFPSCAHESRDQDGVEMEFDLPEPLMDYETLAA